jgi:GH15 family glucan-1,4-alpha-glucosidase
MTTPIADYAMLSDTRTAALVSRALLGDDQHGCWSLRPLDMSATATRRYDGDTFVLITRWESADAVAEVWDFMPQESTGISLVRRIVGVSGSMEFAQSITLRFDYARAVPWVRQAGDDDSPALLAVAGPDAVIIRGARVRPTGRSHRGTVSVHEGEHVDLTLSWFASYEAQPEALDVDRELAETTRWWTQWASRIEHDGPHHDEVVRSLLVLRALSHRDTGGIVAAATTSPPRGLRRVAQLGLPLRLAARCRADARGAHRTRLSGRRRAVAGVAGACDRR